MPTEVSEGISTHVPLSAVSPEPLPAAEPSPPPMPPDESVTHRCANCLTPLTGPFCAQCGQHVADYHRSVWRFVADFFDNVFCWDNKVLRTFGPLLKRPGWLTQEFMDGRRVRYVHPLRLFLFTSAICLTLLQYTHRTAGAHAQTNKGKNGKPGASVSFTPPEKDDDEDATPSPAPAPKVTPAASPAGAIAPQAPTPSASPTEPSLGQVFRDTYKAGHQGDPTADAETARKLAESLKSLGPEVRRDIEAAGGARAFGEKMTTNIQQKLSWVALAMLPIFALLMRLAYGSGGGYYFTYLVFSLHYHTFLLLFWVAYSWLDAMASHVNSALFQLPGLLVGLCLLLPPYYLYRALRQMYGQDRLATAAKVFAIGSLHLIALVVGLAIIGATSFL